MTKPAIGTSAIALAVVIVILTVTLGAYYISTSSALSGKNQTISSLQSTITSLIVNPSTSTVSITYTITRVPSQTETALTITVNPGLPWPLNESMFLSSAPGCSFTVGSESPMYGTCFSYNISQAVVFNCAEVAATPQGCTQQVNSPQSHLPGYMITIWYPYVNQTNEPTGVNCAYSVPSESIDHNLAYCISLSPTAFIVTMKAPPPV